MLNLIQEKLGGGGGVCALGLCIVKERGNEVLNKKVWCFADHWSIQYMTMN